MSAPINEVALIIETLSNTAIRATGFIIEGFQQTNSYGPCMYNNYIANVLLHTLKL